MCVLCRVTHKEMEQNIEHKLFTRVTRRLATRAHCRATAYCTGSQTKTNMRQRRMHIKHWTRPLELAHYTLHERVAAEQALGGQLMDGGREQ